MSSKFDSVLSIAFDLLKVLIAHPELQPATCATRVLLGHSSCCMMVCPSASSGRCLGIRDRSESLLVPIVLPVSQHKSHVNNLKVVR